MDNHRKSFGVQTELLYAEQLRRYLSTNHLLRTDLLLKKTQHHIIFPVTSLPTHLPLTGCTTGSFVFKKKELIPTSYKKLVGDLPEHLVQKLPTSYDIIGDILLIKIPKELTKYKKEIGRALLQVHKPIHVVCAMNPVAGELRTRTVDIIAGEHRTRTTHTEYGLSFTLDVEKTYFSPRLATERKRVASLVKQDETIVDMFAGVAPFSIMIAKYAKPKLVIAVDKNKDAITYAKQNLKQNKVLDLVEPLYADAKNLPKILKKRNINADRIIMNLPFSAHQFFEEALQIAAESCTIHYYDILKQEKIKERLEYLRQEAKNHKIIFEEIMVRTIKTYAPREFYIGIDITAHKVPM